MRQISNMSNIFLNIFSRYGYLILVSCMLLGLIGSFFVAKIGILDYSWSIVFLICLIALLISVVLFRNKDKSNQSFSSSYFNSSKYFYIFSILYLICIVFLLISNHHQQSRDILYFTILILSVIFLTLSILSNCNSVTNFISLFWILIFSALVSFSFFKYFYWYSYDTFAHATFNEYLLYLGSFDIIFGAGVQKEMSFPLSHVFVAVSANIFGIDIRMATILIMVFGGLCTSIVIYSIARYFVHKKVALFALIAYNLFGYVVYFRMMGVTTTYASNIYLILLLLLVHYIFRDNGNKTIDNSTVIVPILMLIITMSHLFSWLIMSVSLFGVVISVYLFQRRDLKKIMKVIGVGFAVCLGYLLYIEWGFGMVVHTIVKSLFMSNSALTGDTYSSVGTYINISEPSLIELVFRFFPSALITVAVITLLCLSIKYFNYNSESICHIRIWYLLIVSIILLLFTGIICIVSTEMSGRVFLFIAPFYAILFSYLIYNIIRTRYDTRGVFNILLILFFVVAICLFGVVNSTIVPDGAYLDKDHSQTRGVTVNEIYGLSSSISIVPFEKTQNIHIDTSLHRPSMYYINIYRLNNMDVISPSLESSLPILDVFDPLYGEYVLYNKKLEREPTEMTTADINDLKQKFILKIDDSYGEVLNGHRNLIYDNFEMKLYGHTH